MFDQEYMELGKKGAEYQKRVAEAEKLTDPQLLAATKLSQSIMTDTLGTVTEQCAVGLKVARDLGATEITPTECEAQAAIVLAVVRSAFAFALWSLDATRGRDNHRIAEIIEKHTR